MTVAKFVMIIDYALKSLIDDIQTLQPDRVLFMDESGFHLTVGQRTMGHSEIGTRCVEVTRYHPIPNISLNLLVALDGPRFYNFVNGPSTTGHYVQFFTDASHTNKDNGQPCISAGDTIVVDNCPLHHNPAEVLLGNYFGPLGVQMIFMPRYSPDFSPAEPLFYESKNSIETISIFWSLARQSESSCQLGTTRGHR